MLNTYKLAYIGFLISTPKLTRIHWKTLYMSKNKVALLFQLRVARTKCFTTSIKKLSMNKSDRLIVYKVCVSLASSTQQCYSFIYFSVVFSVQRFLNMQKSLCGTSHNKFCNFAVIEGNPMLLGIFMCIWTGNKRDSPEFPGIPVLEFSRTGIPGDLGLIFHDSRITNLLLCVQMKEFWKSVNIWWSYEVVQFSGLVYYGQSDINNIRNC